MKRVDPLGVVAVLMPSQAMVEGVTAYHLQGHGVDAECMHRCRGRCRSTGDASPWLGLMLEVRVGLSVSVRVRARVKARVRLRLRFRLRRGCPRARRLQLVPQRAAKGWNWGWRLQRCQWRGGVIAHLVWLGLGLGLG